MQPEGWICQDTFTVRSDGVLSRVFSAAINSIAFSPNGQTLISSSEDWDNPIRLWSIQTGREIGDRDILDSPVKFWDLLTQQEIRPVQAQQPIGDWKLGRFSRIALSSDGEILAIGGTFIELWNLRTQSRIGDLGSMFGHRDMSALAISPDKQLLASTSLGESPFNFRDYSIRLWNLETQQPTHTLTGHSACVRSLVFPDDQTLISAANDGTIKFWNPDTGQERHSLHHGSSVYAIALSPDGRTLLSAGNDRTLESGRIDSLAFSPNGQCIATGGEDATIKIWNPSMNEICTLKGHSGTIHALAFSPTHQTLASGDSKGMIKLWRQQ